MAKATKRSIEEALKRSAEQYRLGRLPLPVQEIEAIRLHLELWASQRNELDDHTLGEHCEELFEAVVKQIIAEQVAFPTPLDDIGDEPVGGVFGEYLANGKDGLFLAASVAIDHFDRQFIDGAEAILTSDLDKTAKVEGLRTLAGSLRRRSFRDYPAEIRTLHRNSDQQATMQEAKGHVVRTLDKRLLEYEALLEPQATALPAPDQKRLESTRRSGVAPYNGAVEEAHPIAPEVAMAGRRENGVDAESVTAERQAALRSYKAECKTAGVKVTNAMIAHAANSRWNNRTPTEKWAKAKDNRYNSPAVDKQIRSVFARKPHLPK